MKQKLAELVIKYKSEYNKDHKYEDDDDGFSNLNLCSFSGFHFNKAGGSWRA